MNENVQKISIGSIIIENKDYIYPSLFYIAGLLLGSFCFKIINNTAFAKLIETVYKNSTTGFSAVLLNRFYLYFSIYAICVLLGLCLIGYPLINIVPALMGAEIALKTAYYYVNFGVKGVGFAMLMIIPEGAAVSTVLIYAIKTSASLSRKIYEITAKGTSGQIEIKLYLKKYLLYGLIIALTALFNALASFLLGAIIKL